jgi:hypothetical protein
VPNLPVLLQVYRDGFGSGFVVLETVHLVDSWSGFGVGAYLAGVVLQRLASDYQFAVADPAPIHWPEPGDPAGDGTNGGFASYEPLGQQETPDRTAARQKLTRVWATLGFEPFADGLMALDLSLVTLDDAVGAMRERLDAVRP